jgi:hypothetical protein
MTVDDAKRLLRAVERALKNRVTVVRVIVSPSGKELKKIWRTHCPITPR